MTSYWGKNNLLNKINMEDLHKVGIKDYHYLLDNNLNLKAILFSYKIITDTVICSIKENAGSYELYVNNNLIQIEKNYKVMLKKFRQRVLQIPKEERSTDG